MLDIDPGTGLGFGLTWWPKAMDLARSLLINCYLGLSSPRPLSLFPLFFCLPNYLFRVCPLLFRFQLNTVNRIKYTRIPKTEKYSFWAQNVSQIQEISL